MMGESQPLGDASGLCDAILRPGLNQANKIWDDVRQGIFYPGLTLLAVCAMATPNVPGGDTNGRVDEWAVRGVGVKSHTRSLPPHLARNSPAPALRAYRTHLISNRAD